MVGTTDNYILSNDGVIISPLPDRNKS